MSLLCNAFLNLFQGEIELFNIRYCTITSICNIGFIVSEYSIARLISNKVRIYLLSIAEVKVVSNLHGIQRCNCRILIILYPISYIVSIANIIIFKY